MTAESAFLRPSGQVIRDAVAPLVPEYQKVFHREALDTTHVRRCVTPSGINKGMHVVCWPLGMLPGRTLAQSRRSELLSTNSAEH